MFKDSKIVICGVGNVGATTAYTIVNQGLCEQLVLIDINKDKAYAEALDMSHAIHFMNRNMKVWSGDYSDCKDADVVILTASAPMPKDSHDRLEMLKPSLTIIGSIVKSVMASGFNGIFVVISNPVDIMTYYTWRISGLPKNQVIGSGTNLDSARLCYELGKMYNLDSKSVHAYVMGEHGDSEVISWGTATIGGKKVENVLLDNASRTKDTTKEKLRKETVEAGWDIFNRKETPRTASLLLSQQFASPFFLMKMQSIRYPSISRDSMASMMYLSLFRRLSIKMVHVRLSRLSSVKMNFRHSRSLQHL